MRRLRNSYRLLALAGVLSVVAWGCSTDSPTAPRQEFPPTPPPSGQTYFISVGADPGGIVISETSPTGTESTTLVVEVHVGGANGPPPADGTTVQVTTSLGSFNSAILVQSGGAALTNGRAFFTLFSGGLPIQLGIATIQAILGNNLGQTEVPISTLEADFIFSNPEGNLSVAFSDTSRGNPTDFLWDFGDGQGSSVQNPSHIYAAPGTYSVSLTVTKTLQGVTLSSNKRQDVDVALVVEPPPP